MRFGALFLLVTVSGWCQLTVLGPQSIYDGQKVTAIDFVANPHRDTTPLRSFLIQKVGEPYSQAKVEASIAALQNTGDFPKVQVNVVPDVDGLRLNFLLEPAYFLGMVNFSGVKSSYTRLLQVTQLSDEDPYDPARIPISEKALTRFFQGNGYFRAWVKAEPQIDDDHQLVNVNFVVRLGKQARVSNVSFEGAIGGEHARLQHSIQSLRARLTGGLLKPGKNYSRARLQKATSELRRALTKQAFLASTVVENPPQYHPDSNRVDVSFKINVGPKVTVRIAGARLSAFPFASGRQQKKLVPIYSEASIDRDLVQEGQQNLTEYFQKKGYFDIQVKTNFQKQPDQILVEYQINKGEKHKLRSISFTGNHELTEKDLLPVLRVKRSHIWTHGSISQKLLKQSEGNLQAVYRDHGYEDVKVTSQVTRRERDLNVEFNIEEGPQTVVRDIQVTGNEHIPQDQLVAPVGFQLRAGAPFSPRRAADDRSRISAAYLNRGYLNVEVKAQVSRDSEDSHQVDVVYTVNEHQQVRVSDVLYLGQERTQLSLLRRTTRLAPESPMRKEQLLAAESRLYDLNIFDWSTVGPRRPITDQTDETTLVKVHEAKRNDITYGFGFEISHRGGNIPSGTVAVPGGPPVQLGGNQIAPSQSTFASPRGSIEYNRRNMRGLGETASASVLVSRLDQRLLLTYAQPHFFGTRWGSLTTLSGERNSENPLFTARLGDASFQLERLLNRKTNTRLQLRYDFNRTSLSDLLVSELVLPRDRNVYLSTFSGTLLRDTRDKPLDAHHGSFSNLTLGITPAVLGSSADFAKLNGQYAFYKPVRSMVFANSIRLGLAKAFNGSFVPTSQLFFSGGGNSLRGFPIDQAGPQRLVPFCDVLTGQTGCVNVTVPVGGRQLFILNSELRFPLSSILKPLGGVVFYDGGNVYSAINFNNFIDNYSNTVGFGIRYSTPIGPVRFDIGRNLNPVPGINPIQYFITLGQSF
jgi:outer membrane protein assembly factor BamA